MTKKKITRAFLAFAICFITIAKPSSVCAEDVTYSVTEQYTWTIHSLVDFGDSIGPNSSSVISKNKAITVTKCSLQTGHELKITLSPANSFEMTTDEGATLQYSVYNQQWADDKIPSSAVSLRAGDTVMTVHNEETASSPVTFCLNTNSGDGVSEIAGDYRGSITYRAEVVDYEE